MEEFRDFYERWKDLIRVTTSAEITKGMYFHESRDRKGFDLLPEFISEHGVEWAVKAAGVFEQRSGLAGRLDGYSMVKFRMVFDRHMLNLTKAAFDEAYLSSSDERSLFLIHRKIPPARVGSALAACKNLSMDFVIEKTQGQRNGRDEALMSAFSTLFMIELNHVMRAYVYFAQRSAESLQLFDVVRKEDTEPHFEYSPPETNGQMSYPDKSKMGELELF